MNQPSAARPPRGLSLVEVVLAIGVVSFAVLAVIGLLGSLSQRGSELADRRDAMQALGALRGYLNDDLGFSGASVAVPDGVGGSFVFGTFREAGTGSGPVRVVARWDRADADWSALAGRVEGRWFHAVLRRAPDLNPSGNEAILPLEVSLYQVPSPDVRPTANDVAILSTQMVVRR